MPRCFTEEAASKGVIMAYERLENYQGSLSGEGTLVLVSWGGASWMDIKSFQAALEQTQKWLAEHKQ